MPYDVFVPKLQPATYSGATAQKRPPKPIPYNNTSSPVPTAPMMASGLSDTGGHGQSTVSYPARPTAAPVPQISPLAPHTAPVPQISPLAPHTAPSPSAQDHITLEAAKAQTQLGNEAIMQQAQRAASMGPQRQTSQMTSSLTQNLLRDPMLGWDEGKYRQSVLDQFNRERAHGIESFREGAADVMNTGKGLESVLLKQMEGADQRSQLERQLAEDEVSRRMQAITNAITQGRETAASERELYNTGISALLGARAAAEGSEQRAFQKEENAVDRALKLTMQDKDIAASSALTELKGKIDKDMLLTTQDFQGAMADLDRAQAKYVADGNWKNATEIEKIRGELQAQRDAAQQKWQTAERNATQAWQTGERLSSQDFSTAMKYLDQKISEAAADKNYARMMQLEDVKYANERAMQDAGFNHAEKMQRAAADLEEARAISDFDRQRQIIKYQWGIEKDRMLEQGKLQEYLQSLQFEHQRALQAGDHVAASELAKINIAAQAEERAKDRIMSLVDPAAIDQGSAVDALRASGIDVRQLDPVSIVEKEKDAAINTHNLEKMIFALRVFGQEAVGANGEITPEAELAFQNANAKALTGEAPKTIDGRTILEFGGLETGVIGRSGEVHAAGNWTPRLLPGQVVKFTKQQKIMDGDSVPPGQYEVIETEDNKTALKDADGKLYVFPGPKTPNKIQLNKWYLGSPFNKLLGVKK